MQKDEIIDLLLKKKENIKLLQKQVYLNDLYHFNTDVLRIEEGADGGHTHVPLASFHQELCTFVEKGKKKYKLILVPRSHLKSTMITVGYSLQRIAKSPNVRILIANATSGMAEAFLRQIKNHLSYNVTFKDLFGDLATGAEKWSDSMIQFATGEGTFKAKEANVTAFGLGGNLVSQHYDVIIIDDPHNRDNVNTKDQIDKVKQSYRDILDLLEPGGELIIIGTRWDYDDLYGMILDPKEYASKSFEVFFRQAVQDSKIERLDGQFKITEGTPLWPEKYNLITLNGLLNDKGIYDFSMQYQNNPVDDSTATFQRSWFKEYDPTEVNKRVLNRFTAIDPAISLKERADYTAIVTVGVDVLGFIYILEIKRGHMSEKEMADEIFYTNEKWHPLSIGIETVAFQKTLQNFIVDEMMKRKARVPIKELMPESSESKEKRIRSLQPLYMRGQVLHAPTIANIEFIEDELIRFPKGKNDDTIDALAYSVSMSFPPRQKDKDEDSRKKHGFLY